MQAPAGYPPGRVPLTLPSQHLLRAPAGYPLGGVPSLYTRAPEASAGWVPAGGTPHPASTPSIPWSKCRLGYLLGKEPFTLPSQHHPTPHNQLTSCKRRLGIPPAGTGRGGESPNSTWQAPAGYPPGRVPLTLPSQHTLNPIEQAPAGYPPGRVPLTLPSQHPLNPMEQGEGRGED